ncbi:MAG: hypothetical protein RRB13_05315 [bacterium]|nr:hypothetical protein [bacterium]
MSEEPVLHKTIVSMVSLAANIAAKHPKNGLCQLERLREWGIPESQLEAVVEIARHIRDEAAEIMDAQFNQKAAFGTAGEVKQPEKKAAETTQESCCTPTASGQSCC